MDVEVANKLVNLRKARGLSQEALAEKIGVSRQAVSKWERAESSPDTDNLISLSKLYNISLDDMLNVDDTGKFDNIDVAEQVGAKSNQKNSSFLKIFPYPIFCTIIFLVLGFIWGWWHPSWLIFLTIPLWGTFVSYRTKKDNNEE